MRFFQTRFRRTSADRDHTVKGPSTLGQLRSAAALLVAVPALTGLLAQSWASTNPHKGSSAPSRAGHATTARVSEEKGLFRVPPPTPVDTTKGLDAALSKMKVRNMGRIINGGQRDVGPTITADGRFLYFVSRRDGGKGLDDFWYTVNDLGDDTTWNVQPVNLSDINTKDADGAASIAADGQTIYYASSTNTTETGDLNIWVATLEGRTWKNIHEIGAPINTTAYESQPSISPDGKKLFFASNRAGKIGNEKKSNVDIFVSHQLADGRWTNPINLGTKINTEKYDGTPFLAADGTTLYFCSEGHNSMGKKDLFRAEWVGPSDSDWTEPSRLPEPINSVSDDLSLTVPASGNVLFFASDRSGGEGDWDLYMASNPPPPKASLVLKGTAYDVNTKEKLGAHVIVTDQTTGDTIYNKQANTATGEYLVVLSSDRQGYLGGKYTISATEPNHFPYPPTLIDIPRRNDTTRIWVHDIPMNNELPPIVHWVTTTPQFMVDHPDKFPGFKGVIIKEQATIELFALLPMVFFDKGVGALPSRYVLYNSPEQTQGFTEDTLSATLNAYYNYLNCVGLRMRNNPTTKIRLVGTNSQEDPTEKSVELSRNRADGVKKYLVEIWGIDPSRISVEARNLPESPTMSTTPEGIEENRRVEVLSDSWEIVKPIKFSQAVKVPDHRNVKFSMVNGLREEMIAKRSLMISHNGQPWAEMLDLGPISAQESPEWNWRSMAMSPTGNGKLPVDETPMMVQLKITDKNGREVLSNVDTTGVRQYSVKQVVAENLGEKTRETYNLILFTYNKSDMGKWNHKILDTYVYDRITPSSDVSVNGYTDILGTPDYNEKLSTNRANAVRGDIAGQAKGKVQSLVAHGYGKTQPLYTNDLPEGRYYNRTVQVLIETPLSAAGNQ